MNENKDLLVGVQKLNIDELNKLIELAETPGFAILGRIFDETFNRLKEDAFYDISAADKVTWLKHGNRHGQYETMEIVRNIGKSAQEQIKHRERKDMKGDVKK